MRMMVELLLYFKMRCGRIIAKDLIGREQARDESGEGGSL